MELIVEIIITLVSLMIGYFIFWFAERNQPQKWCLKNYKYVCLIMLVTTLLEYYCGIPSFIIIIFIAIVGTTYKYVQWKRRRNS